ncbi:MAG: hypothetical protein KC549_18170, partial [Myxococcales bacterium]|nr:hypothetical protein [Myxococcales bacterium]
LAERFGVPAPGLDEDWAAWAHWEPKVPCTWAQHRLDGFGSAIREPKVFRQARTRALSNTMWLFSALYAVRNRRVHEAFRPEARDLPRLTRLFEACRVLTASLINQRDGAGRWEAAGELLRALEPKKQQEAFMPCTLLDHLGSGRS